MSNTFEDWDNETFANYLDMVGYDYLESGSYATAVDYFEAAKRLRECND